MDVLSVNLAFMGVTLRAGEHVIEFTYRVRGLALGALMSACAALVWAVYARGIRRAAQKACEAGRI